MKNKNFYLAVLQKPAAVCFGFVLLALLTVKGRELIQNQQQKIIEKQQTEQLNALDTQIQQHFQAVHRLRDGIDKQTADSLMRHPEYKFVMDNMAATDSLRASNKKLLTRACNAAQKLSVFEIVRHNESVFSDFAHVPTVKNIKWRYYANKNKIRNFDKCKLSVQHVPRFVRMHFDSVTNAEIYKLQLELDSLLNQKNQVLKSR